MADKRVLPILDRSTLVFTKTRGELLDACNKRIAAIESEALKLGLSSAQTNVNASFRIFKTVRDHVENVALDGDNLVPLSLADLVYFFGPHAASESEE